MDETHVVEGIWAHIEVGSTRLNKFQSCIQKALKGTQLVVAC